LWKGDGILKINQINLGSTQSGAVGMEAQVRNVEGGPVQKRPVEKMTVDNQAKKSEHVKADGTKEDINEEMFNKSVEQANKTLEFYNRRIERAVHEVTHTVMYTIKDTVTNEVISEFPPKKIQDMIAKMWELAGLFVDEKA